MKFEQFKRQCEERLSDGGYIDSGFVLKINGSIVNYLYFAIDKNDDIYCYVDYESQCVVNDNIYQYEVDENNEYRIEWFVLENDDV